MPADAHRFDSSFTEEMTGYPVISDDAMSETTAVEVNDNDQVIYIAPGLTTPLRRRALVLAIMWVIFGADAVPEFVGAYCPIAELLSRMN